MKDAPQGLEVLKGIRTRPPFGGTDAVCIRVQWTRSERSYKPPQCADKPSAKRTQLPCNLHIINTSLYAIVVPFDDSSSKCCDVFVVRDDTPTTANTKRKGRRRLNRFHLVRHNVVIGRRRRHGFFQRQNSLCPFQLKAMFQQHIQSLAAFKRDTSSRCSRSETKNGKRLPVRIRRQPTHRVQI